MNIKAAPLLGYDFFKENHNIFSGIEEIEIEFRKAGINLSNKSKCSSCSEVGAKKRFSNFLVEYLIKNNRLDIFKELPSNMVVPYGRMIYRVREILEKSGRINK